MIGEQIINQIQPMGDSNVDSLFFVNQSILTDNAGSLMLSILEDGTVNFKQEIALML
jgi:hypothetical protein